MSLMNLSLTNWEALRFAKEEWTAIPETAKNKGMIQPETKVSNRVNPRSGVEFIICHEGKMTKGLLL